MPAKKFVFGEYLKDVTHEQEKRARDWGLAHNYYQSANTGIHLRGGRMTKLCHGWKEFYKMHQQQIDKAAYL